MADDPHDPLNEVVDHVADGLTMSTNRKKLVAKVTTKAYIKDIVADALLNGAAAAAVALPLMANGVPTLAQQQVIRKPDEHLASQSHNKTAPQEGVHLFNVAVTSASFSTELYVVKDEPKPD